MTTEDIAYDFVNLCRKGQNAIAQVMYFDDHIESIEPKGNRIKKIRGIRKVQKKTATFFEMAQEIHEASISDPLVIQNFFCVKINLDVTLRGVGRVKSEQLAVYRLREDKIYKEEFLYTPFSF